MATVDRKEGDTKPIDATLRNKSGKPINLTGITSVTFFAAPEMAGVGSALNKACSVLGDPTKGRARLVLTALELPAGATGPATYKVEYRIVFSDGTEETVPNKSYEHIVVWPDLG